MSDSDPSRRCNSVGYSPAGTSIAHDGPVMGPIGGYAVSRPWAIGAVVLAVVVVVVVVMLVMMNMHGASAGSGSSGGYGY